MNKDNYLAFMNKRYSIKLIFVVGGENKNIEEFKKYALVHEEYVEDAYWLEQEDEELEMEDIDFSENEEDEDEDDEKTYIRYSCGSIQSGSCSGGYARCAMGIRRCWDTKVRVNEEKPVNYKIFQPPILK